MVATTCDVIVDYTTGNVGRFMPPQSGFGSSSPVPNRRPTANQVPTRARKVTITEITEDNDDWSLISNDGSEDGLDMEGPSKTTEEAFKMFDDLVQDWKSKLEVIVGEGLKKLRKNGREKKLMMKYLPGDNAKKVNARIAESKTAIYKDWRIEFNKIMGQSQKKIEKLAHEKMVEAEQLIADNLLPKNSDESSRVNQNKKTLVNVEFENEDSGNGDGYQNLMELIRDLEKVCNVFSPLDNGNRPPSAVQSPIPIYQPNLNTGSKLSSADPKIDRAIWLREYLEPLQNEVFHHEGIRSILEEFKVKHFNGDNNNESSKNKISSYCSPALKVKTDRRSTHVNAAQKKMLERKQKREAKEAAVAKETNAVKESGKYKLVQVQKDGKERFLICKKNERQTPDKNASEEIFAEWNKNLEAPPTQPKKKRQRTRKLTHRYLRKAVVKSAKEASCKGSYAEMLKKNLKNSQLPQPNVEDILEAWRDSLRGLELQAQSQKAAARSLAKQERQQDAEDIFKAWRHNLNVERNSTKPKKASESVEQILYTAKPLFQPELSGAQPTVASIQKHSKTAAFGRQGKLKPVAKHLKLGGGDKAQQLQQESEILAGTRSYEAEEIFAQWRPNLSDTFFLKQQQQHTCQVKESSKRHQNKKSQSSQGSNHSSKQQPAEKVLQISQHETPSSKKTDEQQKQLEDVDDFVVCKPKRRNSRKNKAAAKVGEGGQPEAAGSFDQKFFADLSTIEDFAEDPEVYQPKKGGRKGGKGGKNRAGRNNSNI